MIKGEELLNWQTVGAILATKSSNEQTTFFKAFIEECRSWGTRLQVEQQLSHVNLALTDDERETLSMLGLRSE